MLQFQITLVVKCPCLQLHSRIYLHLDRPLPFLLRKLYVLNMLLRPLFLINEITHIHVLLNPYLLNAYIRLLLSHIINRNLFLLLFHLLLFLCHILLPFMPMHLYPALMFIQILLVQIPILLLLSFFALY